MQRKSVTLTKRFQIMKRDGFKCCVCGRTPATTVGLVLEVDHIHPVSKGGSNHPDNLRTVCFDCNRGKRDKLIVDNTYRSTEDVFVKVGSENHLDVYKNVIISAVEKDGLKISDLKRATPKSIPVFAKESIRAMSPQSQYFAEVLLDAGWISVV